MIEERSEEYKTHALFERLLQYSKEKRQQDLERRHENPYAADVQNLFAIHKVPGNMQASKEVKIVKKEENKFGEIIEYEEDEDDDQPKQEYRNETALQIFNKDYDAREALTVDEVMCLYLRDVSRKVNKQFYKTTLRFVLLFRDCLNEWGWMKRRDNFMKAEMLDSDEIV